MKNTHQYLTFQLDREWYGIEVSRIEEVLEYQPITRVPKMPESMRGVINVRGNIVPVVDLRQKFGLAISEVTVDTCIIVLEVAAEGETIRIGTIADTVEEVVEIVPEQIEPAPKIGTKMDTY
ncbi:MAG TPA: chemotaxis protein CheW, partial [Clostridia bacterium]|nr:chemotaxis protein CheW [Clostridia bacterium]